MTRQIYVEFAYGPGEQETLEDRLDRLDKQMYHQQGIHVFGPVGIISAKIDLDYCLLVLLADQFLHDRIRPYGKLEL